MTEFEGVVLRERAVGEQDKFIDILTKERGVIELSAKGSRKINAKTGSSAQLFAYSRFCAAQRGERLYLNSAEPIHIFYGLRSSLSKVSLASYFADILRFCIGEETDSGEVMRLFLNVLHYLEKDLRSEAMLKAVFELRLMSEIGFMPDITACLGCGDFEPARLFFSVDDGSFMCSSCAGGSGEFPAELPLLRTVRHIVLSPQERLFNFKVSDRDQESLSEFAELYLTTHLERSFRTLDFYKSIIRS